MSEKIKIQPFPISKNVDVNINLPNGESATIEVNPYINLNNQITFTLEYLKNLFDDPDIVFPASMTMAEHVLVLNIISENTNIDLDGINSDMIYSTGLWNIIQSNLENYANFRYDLKRSIDIYLQKKIIESSMGNAVTNLFTKVEGMLDNINQLNVDELSQGIEKISEGFDALNEKFPGIAGKPATPIKKSSTRGRKTTKIVS